jgi:hypothetical protein
VLDNDAAAKAKTMGQGQTRVHLPNWLIIITALSAAAWLADAIWGQWSSHDLQWSVWLHWTALALVATSILALTVVAIRSHFRDRH